MLTLVCKLANEISCSQIGALSGPRKRKGGGVGWGGRGLGRARTVLNRKLERDMDPRFRESEVNVP